MSTNTRPILFSGEMVRAILEGRKTQTRRIVKPQPEMVTANSIQKWDGDPATLLQLLAQNKRDCPFGKPGDRLWVRETWSDVNLQGAPGIAYRADDDIRDLMNEPDFHDEDGAFNYDDERVKPYHFAVWCEDLLSGLEGRWRPSIHMPRWASRITLEITDVRVERLQDISDADAKSEGCWYGKGGGESDPAIRPEDHFPTLWEAINGTGSWDTNPWVWVIKFKRIPQEASQ